MTDRLAASYGHCCRLARRAAKNFYYSFIGLPGDKYRGMCALYAYMRVCDDIGDDESRSIADRAADLDEWESIARHAFAHGTDELEPLCKNVSRIDSERLAIWPAVHDTMARFAIPQQYFFDVLTGMRMDLESVSLPIGNPPRQRGISDDGLLTMGRDGIATGLQCRHQTFSDLERYCYHVAGVVGLCCIHIWGFHGSGATERAIDCGLAFQLTNILRDLGTDADDGRVYLPAEDFAKFNIDPQSLSARVQDDAFRELMSFEVERAKQYYARAEELFADLSPDGRPILQAMLKIYGGLLREIERRDYDVYSRRVSLPMWRKMWIAADACIRQKLRRRAG